jgi:hypothetical protein
LEENYILEQKAVFYGIDHSDWINVDMLKRIKDELNIAGQYKYTYFLVEWQIKGQFNQIEKNTYTIWFEDKNLLNYEWKLIKKLNSNIDDFKYSKILDKIKSISVKRSKIAENFLNIIKNDLAKNNKSWIIIIVVWALHWNDFNWIELNWKINNINNLNYIN